MLQKNIVIFGSGKTGKSMLSKTISEKHDCFIHDTKNILKSIKKTFPNDSEITYDKFETAFLVEYIHRLSSGPDFIVSNKNVVEICTNNIKEIIDKIDYERNIVIGLTHGNINEEQLLKNIKTNESDLDITHFLSIDTLKTMVKEYLDADKNMIKIFNSNDIKCFDTSGDRSIIFENINNEIVNNPNSLILK